MDGVGGIVESVQLTAEEIRVLGCLAEKERTTPDDYPLTKNAVLRACNQTTSRFPIVTYSEATVDDTLAKLKERGYTRFVHQAHGRAVTRYRQVFQEKHELSDAQMALLAALALRGPQTLVELKTRTERSFGFESLDGVRSVLETLAIADPAPGIDEPLVELLERQPGQKEARWTHRLSGEAELIVEGGGTRVAAVAEAVSEVAALRDRVQALETTVALLQDRFEELVGPIE